MQNHDYLNGETVATLRQCDIITHMPRCIMPFSLPGKHFSQHCRRPLLHWTTHILGARASTPACGAVWNLLFPGTTFTGVHARMWRGRSVQNASAASAGQRRRSEFAVQRSRIHHVTP